MSKSWQIVLTILCVFMILTLPLLVPSPKLLDSAVDRILEESPQENWDEGAFLLNWLLPSAYAEETVYSLPIDLTTPGNEPNPDCYTENGYEDNSISVKMEIREFPDTDNIQWCIAWITIKSPSQLRTATAGSIKSKKTALISSMANNSNAILAINGDLFVDDPQKTTFEYRMGQKIRNKTNRKKDILIIDENSDFHLFVKSDANKLAEFNNSGHQIINAYTFGPALVIDGELQKIDTSYSYNPNGREPRMAIGQTGPLSYVVVMADVHNRKAKPEGISLQAMADMMYELGCQQAFNLDGGNTAEMVFNNTFYGFRTGNERPQSDIIYFATAVDPVTWKEQ